MPTGAAWEQKPSGTPTVSDSVLSRISSVAFRQKGVTLGDITSELKVSRATATRWLALMHAEGFLKRSTDHSGTRGRPRWIYHPTGRLRARVASFESDALAVLSFEALREACKYSADGDCTLKPLPCNALVCPIVNS